MLRPHLREEHADVQRREDLVVQRQVRHLQTHAPAVQSHPEADC